MTARIGLFLLAFFAAAPTVSAGMAPQTECSDWRACRELALAAADRRDYSAFHDLAWRAVQTGPRNDPSLLYLLARAQVQRIGIGRRPRRRRRRLAQFHLQRLDGRF